jgi:hypothetical protein
MRRLLLQDDEDVLAVEGVAGGVDKGVEGEVVGAGLQGAGEGAVVAGEAGGGGGGVAEEVEVDVGVAAVEQAGA